MEAPTESRRDVRSARRRGTERTKLPMRFHFTTPDLPLRFWSKIYVTPVGCWEWQGSRNESGYGRWHTGIKNELVHRLLYERMVAPIGPGFYSDHLCRNPPCANPRHIEPVTASQNTLRGDGPRLLKERYHRQTHCKRGHPLSGGNVFITPSGWRNCRTCRAAARKRWKARNPRCFADMRLAILGGSHD